MIDFLKIHRLIREGEGMTLAARVVVERTSGWRTIGTVTRCGEECVTDIRVAADFFQERWGAAAREAGDSRPRGWIVEFGLRYSCDFIEPVGAAPLTKRYFRSEELGASRPTPARHIPGGPSGLRPAWPAEHRFLAKGHGRKPVGQ